MTLSKATLCPLLAELLLKLITTPYQNYLLAVVYLQRDGLFKYDSGKNSKTLVATVA